MKSFASFTVALYISVVFIVQRNALGFILAKKTVCYGELGCFSATYPFSCPERPMSLLPLSPDSIRTRFILYTRENPGYGYGLDARKIENIKVQWSHFKPRETKLIVHGFLDNYNIVAWPTDMKNELLTHGDYNTIIVDWHHGNIPPYPQATANTRVVGAQIAVLIRQMQFDFNVTSNMVHIIGHSLGSHIGGYAGERVPALARISGLDPAGPYFTGTEEAVRLDPTDATLVDIIHSDGKDVIELGTGIVQAVGHMDFYPNNGYDQPGCERGVFNLMTTFIEGGFRELFACNHLRAIKFFAESINTKCPFMALMCDSEFDYKYHNCHTHRENGWAAMGFHADKYRPSTGQLLKYYTTTSDESPFCQYPTEVIIKLTNETAATAGRGIIKIRLHEDKRKSKWIRVDEEPIIYRPGSTHERTTYLNYDIANVTSLEVKWHYYPSINDRDSWTPFWWRRPTMHLQEVQILIPGHQQEARFCTDDRAMEPGRSKSLSSFCV